MINLKTKINLFSFASSKLDSSGERLWVSLGVSCNDLLGFVDGFCAENGFPKVVSEFEPFVADSDVILQAF